MTIDEEVIKFREENMSHNSADEFLSNLGKNVENVSGDYIQIFLSVVYTNKSDKDYVYKTELNLAKMAMEKGCEYVTNIDYCQPVIAATGLKPKKE